MTATLKDVTARYVDMDGAILKEFTGSNKGQNNFSAATDEKTGSKVFSREKMPVFRTGEFKDSMGFSSKWTDMHLEQMVGHYNLLRASGVFADVPIRKGHGSLFGDPIDSLIGYVTGLSLEKRTSYVDGNEYNYLLADVEIIDPDAQEKINSGLWRNVSSEIGMLEGNDGAEYWPVFKGFAYVDIPAVEGLKEFSKSHTEHRTIIGGTMTETKTPVAGATPKGDGETKHAAPRNDFMFSIEKGEVTTHDYAKVQNYIKDLEGKNKSLADSVAEHEKFKAELNEFARAEFVDSLVESGKILAPNKDEALEFAKGMSDDQFESYKKLMGATAPNTLTQDHSIQQDAPVGSAATAEDAKKERIGVLREIVSAHKASNPNNMDFVKNTATYKELVELDPSFQL